MTAERPISKLVLAWRSLLRFIRLARSDRLHLKYARINQLFAVKGHRYAIFRETHCRDVTGDPVVLVIGFRLRFIRSNALFHWLFQRICILTTPFWSGLDGFRTKLWMVDPKTEDYLGIYDWRSSDKARMYIRFLLPILRFFSVGGSVWHYQLNGQDFESFLSSRATTPTI